MSKYIPGNQKHLTLDDRIYIQNELCKGTSFKDIARFLCKDPTTISKEVKVHRLSDWYHKGTFYNAKNFCVHRYHCKKTNACGKILLCGIKCTSCPTCNQTCPDFEKERCNRLDKAPYVCNGCDKQISHCTIAHKYTYNARFADLCNNILYGGREVILPEDLKERDTTEVLTALGLDKKTIAVQKLRDIFKNASIKYTGKSYVVLIGVENQSDIHYSIPVKNMFYDVMAYGNQVKETAKKHRKEKDTATSDEFLSGFTKTDKLIPVITITVYLGIKEWDGPRKLSDMFGDVDEELLPFIPDYRINLLAPREITDFTGFRTSIRQLFEVLQNAYDKEKMQEVLQNDEKFSKVDRETVEAINLFAGTDIDIDEKEEVIDMCKAWEDQKNEGRKLGREEGRIRQAKVTALKLQKKGYSIEDIAECVDFDEETVKKWLVS